MSFVAVDTSRPAGFTQLIRRVHCRLIFLRLLEGAGLGTLVGSLFALVLVPLLSWHGTPDLLVPIVWSMGLGMLGGVLRAWSYRPAPIQAAVQIDRQLHLADLLSTALLLSNDPGDSWRQSVIGLANARCAQVRPGALVLNRLGARAWGAISLIATLSLTLAFLAASTTQMRADEAIEQSRLAQQQLDEQVARPLLVVAPDGSLRRPSAPTEAEDSAHANPNDAGVQSGTPPESSSPRRPAGDQSLSDPAGTSHANAEGSGARGARTDANQHSQPRQPDVPASSDPRPLDPDGVESASGSSPSEERPGGLHGGDKSMDSSGAGRASRAPRRAAIIPPWQTDQWLSEVRAAEQAIQADRIAPAFHDIVRDYFQPIP